MKKLALVGLVALSILPFTINAQVSVDNRVKSEKGLVRPVSKDFQGNDRKVMPPAAVPPSTVVRPMPGAVNTGNINKECEELSNKIMSGVGNKTLKDQCDSVLKPNRNKILECANKQPFAFGSVDIAKNSLKACDGLKPPCTEAKVGSPEAISCYFSGGTTNIGCPIAPGQIKN